MPHPNLFPVVFVLNGIDGAAGFGGERVIELGVLAEAASVAKERILFVVIDRAAFVALVNVLSAVAANARVRRNRGAEIERRGM